MSHSRMLQTRRRKQAGKKRLAREEKQVKKLAKDSAKPASTQRSETAAQP